MAWILVAEAEGRFAERIRDGLAADGWQVEIVPSIDAATAAASARAPEMVIASADLAGASDLLGRFARRAGGSGAIALLPEIGGGDDAAAAADESLAKPFTDKDLRLAVRRLATSGRAPRAQAPAEIGGERLTSKDLFGDVLAEMEREVEPVRAPSPPPPVSRPAPAAAARAVSSDVERALERTLSGLLKEEKPRPPAVKKRAGGVDDLISRTLSGLDVGERPRRPAPPPPASPPPAAASPAEPRSEPPPDSLPPFVLPPLVLPPLELPPPVLPPLDEPAPAPRAAAAPPPAIAPPAAPAPRPLQPDEVERMLAAARTPAAEPRRTSREIDLSQLDALAHPKPREKTPEGFATQRVALPSALRGKSSPTEFGQYTLLERIAVGGMAEVWKARMKGLEGFQKTVAIKKILPHLTDSSDFVTMFIDEAKLAAQLNHNNIIHIYDLGKLGDDYYIAMEFVDGKDLRSILNTSREKHQPLPMSLALLVASRLASALDHAHHKRDFEGREMGLVHRDVSPQNVLISFEGDIKLCDFGIVKAVAKASKTQMGALKGKLQYMSPEQAWGRPVDSRSDIFSLGSLLFEMLTGRRLFAGDSEMSVLDAVREGRIQAPRDLDPRLPLEVNNLVLRALSKEPSDRFESAGEMGREIDAILLSLKPAPAPQDLAAYLKQLVGAEARADAPVLRTITPVAPAASAAAVPPAPAPPVVAHAARAESSRSGVAVDGALEAAAARSQRLIWIAAAAALVLGVGAWLFFGRGERTPTEATPALDSDRSDRSDRSHAADGVEPAAASPTDAPAAATTADGTAPTASVAQIVGDEVRKREEELKRRYEEELRRKQQELAAAATAAPAPAAAQPPAAAPEAAPEASAPTPAETDPEPAAAAPTPAEAPPAVPEPAPAEPAPVDPAAAEPTLPAANAPAVQEGDLVRAGPGVKPPLFVSIDKPEYPPIARRMKVEGTVILSLLVDETGRVTDVRLERGVQQNVGINEAATKAARTARFQPATQGGVKVKMWYQLKIPFQM